MGNASAKAPPGDSCRTGAEGIAKSFGMITRWTDFVDIDSQGRLESRTGDVPDVPYVIDGNNLLGSWGGPSAGDDRRAEDVQRVAAFCRARGARATLVFDGHPLRPDMAAQDLGPLRLRVPPAGTDADTLIREIIDTVERPSELVVVTSDKALYSYAKTQGASVLRAHEWN